MSRVKSGVNENKYDHTVTDISKKTRIHFEGEDYHKSGTLSGWLFTKYDMSYKTYRRKSAARRQELREEYMQDTGNDMRTQRQREEDDCMELLASIGVPFAPDGTPLGIGWD